MPDLERLARAADAEGLLDVATATYDAPMGPLLLASTPAGLVRVAYEYDEGHDAVVADLAARVSPRILWAPARLDDVRRQLDDYFAGRRRDFDVALDWRLVRGPFTVEVLRATATIPYGTVVAYRDVAAMAGRPAAVRAAGNALGSNPLPVVVPCHRVVRSGGNLGGYTGGLDKKLTLLKIEGVLAG